MSSTLVKHGINVALPNIDLLAPTQGVYNATMSVVNPTWVNYTSHHWTLETQGVDYVTIDVVYPSWVNNINHHFNTWNLRWSLGDK